MTSRFSRWFLAIALAQASAVFAQTTPSAPVAPILRIQDYPGIVGTLARVAIDKGYCAKHGIQCTLQTIPAAPLGVQTLLAGGIDVALAPSEVAIQAVAKGADLKIVGGMFNASPFMLFVSTRLGAAADKKYPEVMHELKGKKIGVTSRGAGPEFQFKSMLEAAGMRPDDVTYVAVGSPNTGYPALVNGQIDAAMSFVPFDGFCDVLKTCKIAIQPAKGEGPPVITRLNGAGGLYVMRREAVDKNPKVADAFFKALQDAEHFATNPANAAELLKITLKYYRVDMPKGDEILEDSLARFRSNFVAEVKPQAVQAAADYLLQTKQIDKPFDASRLF